MKQTAVEWLEDKLNNVRPTQICSIETIKEWVKQSKEMEKQQIIDAYIEGNYKSNRDMYWKKQSAEQYYNEQFKNK